MGYEYEPNTRGFGASFWQEQNDRRREEKFDCAKRWAEADATADALRALAEMNFPPELRETSRRWNLETFMREIWTRAYVQGWKESRMPTALGDARGAGGEG